MRYWKIFFGAGGVGDGPVPSNGDFRVRCARFVIYEPECAKHLLMLHAWLVKVSTYVSEHGDVSGLEVGDGWFSQGMRESLCDFPRVNR